MTRAEALRAAGDTTFAMWARIALGLTLCLVLLAVVLLRRFRAGAWKEIGLTEPVL